MYSDNYASVHGDSRPYYGYISALVGLRPPMYSDTSMFMASHAKCTRQVDARIESL